MEKVLTLRFPHCTILKASAGSGKTYALARRFVFFLLSDSIPRNSLPSLLAITFSNNAAREMKERILNLLKQLSLGDDDTLLEFGQALRLSRDALQERAGRLIEEILSDYGDFQVKTIDSFMATIFKASSIDFGYNPDFEIVMNNGKTMEYALSLYLRKVREGTAEGRLMGDVLDMLVANRPGESAFPWEPTPEILAEIGEIYRKLAASGKAVYLPEADGEVDRVVHEIREAARSLQDLIRNSGLEINRSSSFEGIIAAVNAGRFRDLSEKGMKNPPVRKPGKETDAEGYNEVLLGWAELEALIGTYTRIQAVVHYAPYLKAYSGFSGILERIKRVEGKVFIEDINRLLAEYVDEYVAPEIYCRLGEAIFHYFIDEFQDTSPVQWRSLFPLLENTLSQEGSLFIVGDTKQAIYGFRDADYRIMSGMEREAAFPSAHHSVEELSTNYRSDERIVAFAERVFQHSLPEYGDYVEAARESGLLSYRQGVGPQRKGCGYVETCVVTRNDEVFPEREKLLQVLADLTNRGYRLSDITILASKNDEVIRITTWLNAVQIPVLSYSSLDIRRRKIVGEILALLEFLDSPVDDLAFATFLLGDIFRSALEGQRKGVTGQIHTICLTDRGGRGRPLYKVFQDHMADVWEDYFDRLFRSSGYLPLYDLIVEIYRVFDLFRLFGSREEAVLVKIIEVAKGLEIKGGSSLRTFLQFAADSGPGDVNWNVDVPQGMDAVKVMTVHKAKGLGFPVVILMQYGERNKGFKHILDEREDSVALLRLTRKTAGCDKEFERLYCEEERKEKVNKLNSLYVAFTRASSELYVIGAKREKEAFPFVLFPGNMSYRDGETASAQSRCSDETLLLDNFRYRGQAPVPTGSTGMMHFEERRRGELIHNVLATVTYLTDKLREEVGEALRRVSGNTGIDLVAAELCDRIERLLKNGDLFPYYEPRSGRTVFLEYELTDATGRLFRVDRVVIDPDRVTIIEYKTGEDGVYEEKYLAQMHTYLDLVRDLFPDKAVQGLIGYVDLAKTKKVA